MCTTAEDEETSDEYVVGSKAEPECHCTLVTQVGVWPAGVVYGLPD